MPTTSEMDNVRTKLASETGLTEVVTLRRDGRPLVSVVNAGVIPHPATGSAVVAFVSHGRAARLSHLRRTPEITLAVRRGWEWVGIEGTAELAGPNDPHPGIPADAIAGLLRDVFVAAGGQHDDWDEYDRVMAEGERTAVLVVPEQIYGNNPSR